MVIASLAVFSKQLSIEDVTYAFTYDDTGNLSISYVKSVLRITNL